MVGGFLREAKEHAGVHTCTPMLKQNYVTGVRLLLPLVSVEPRSLGLFGFPSRTRGSLLKKFSPQAHPENVKVIPAQPPDPGLAEKL